MATYDPEGKLLVIRIVYDGAALAGKTSSLRALARKLGRPMFSGEEAEGRTLFFDWVDFVGGRFEGSPIRCQIVAVPGQIQLHSRRKALLETADVIVLVVDSTRAGAAEARLALPALREIVESKRPPVGVLVQANKRDADDILSLRALEDLTAELGSVALTETVATTGEGVRETFVFAVRLALDRVQELGRSGALPHRPPEIGSGEELLAAIRRVESEPAVELEVLPSSPVERRDPQPFRSSPEIEPTPDTPAPPTSDVAPGNLWPPIDGRVVLHEAERRLSFPSQTPNGDWAARSASWFGYSARQDSYADLEVGRETLIAWARWHASIRPMLSDRRAIVLAGTQAAGWRLWQVVGRYRTLKDDLSTMLEAGDVREIGELLRRAAQALVFAETELVAAGFLHRTGLGSLAFSGGRVVFTGLVPAVSAPRPKTRRPLEPQELLRRQMQPWIEESGIQARKDVARILDELLWTPPQEERLPHLETVAAMLIGH